jgi:predicted kinase
MSGLPFSGKTYLSKRLAETTGFVRVSYDDIWEEKNKELHKWLDWNQVTAIAHKQILALFNDGKSVIYDDLGDTLEIREGLQALAEKVGAESRIVYVNIPEKVRQERHKKNKIVPERHDISNQRFKRSAKRFDPPGKGENVIVFDLRHNIDEWIKDYF